MTVDEAVELIREAVARFTDAGVPWQRSRIGIFGFWVGDNPLERIETPLPRAQLSERAWAHLHKDMKNPYTCIVEFFSLGGELTRWEHGILDVLTSEGGRLGVTEGTLRRAQNN